MSIRVVLDTNVVLSALVFEEGRLAWLRRAWMTGACVPLVSRATVEELLRALAYPKFGLSREDREELLGDYLPFSESVTGTGMVEDLPECTDPDDQKFLELASVGRARFLVTGDKALLSLRERCPFRIVRPVEVRDSLLASR